VHGSLREFFRVRAFQVPEMGDLLQFPIDRVRASEPPGAGAPAFFFDVACPFSYLAAEDVERRLPDAVWVPVDGAALVDPPARGPGLVAPPAGGPERTAPPAGEPALARLRARAEARARELRLPLVWPDEFPLPARGARRAAALACELGAGPAFALAAGRLAFCGGFALEDPETIAEAAAAAALPLAPCLEAAGECGRDEELAATSAALRSAGVHGLPAFRVARRWLQGERALDTAAALALRGARAQGPLAPAR